MSHPEFERVLILSTAHVLESDGETMDTLARHGTRLWRATGDETGPCRGAFTEGAWFCTYLNSPDEAVADLLSGGTCWSDELIAALEYARGLDADYVLFDRDGPEVDALPTFDW